MTPEQLELLTEHFRENLDGLVQIARAKGIPVETITHEIAAVLGGCVAVYGIPEWSVTASMEASVDSCMEALERRMLATPNVFGRPEGEA
jgi:hypothetical protein